MKTCWKNLSLTLMLLVATAGLAHEFQAGALTIKHPWSRPTAEGMPMGVAYFVIVNGGKTPDTLLAARTPVAESVEFHRTLIEDGMARMRPAGTLVIAPGATLKAEPEGLHLMLVGLKQPLVAGTEVPLELQFKVAGWVPVKLKVEAGAGTHTHGGH